MAARILLIAASIYTGILTLTSLIKLGEISVGEYSPTDKFLHFVAYFGLVVAWQLYFLFREEHSARFAVYLLKVALCSLVFGMLIEVLQGLVTTYREPDWYDIVANSCGIVTAAMLLFLLKNRLQRLKSKINLIF